MGIFSRLNTVIRSNLNALVDQAEDPEKLIQQTVIDLEAELKRARRELVTTLGASKRLDKKSAELDEEIEGWEKKAVLALEQDDEDLAREALRRKQRLSKEAQRVREQAAQAATAADEMRSTLERVEEKLEDLKARRSALAAQVRQARQAPPTTAAGRFGGGTFDELERMTGRIDQLDAEVEAHQALTEVEGVLEGPGRADVEARFRALEKNTASDAVEDELQALKRKLGG